VERAGERTWPAKDFEREHGEAVGQHSIALLRDGRSHIRV
jgi:hypothetical protein